MSLDHRVRVEGAFFATGSRVVVKGRGLLRIGERVHLANVLIDMGEDGVLTIPDGWTLHDTYIHAGCQFDGANGFLSGVFRSDPSSHHILPAVGETFSGSQCTTFVLSGCGESIRVDTPLTACRDVLAAVRSGPVPLRLEASQNQTDILAGVMDTEGLNEIITRELTSAPPLFPIEPDQVQIISSLQYAQWVSQLASEIIARKSPAGLFWVTIEGLPAAGKSYLATVLRRELRSRGQAAIIFEEDWVHFSRPNREQLRINDQALFAFHRETWHDWDRNREVVSTLTHAGTGYVTLHGLYNRASGLCDLNKRLYCRTGGTIIYTGFYVSDASLHGIPDGHEKRLSVYLGISPEDSLLEKLRRDRWRSCEETLAYDAAIYRPAFTRYTRLFNPAGKADYAIRVDPGDRNTVELVRPTNARY